MKSGSRKNKNRGYQQLRVWQDSVDLYILTCNIFRKLPYDLKRVVSQAIASSDSVHRNIAEGYCRKSIKEYLYFLNISLGSLGESVSGFLTYHKAKQISDESFEKLDILSFKIENGLLKLIERLEEKRNKGEWVDSMVVRESNIEYGSDLD